MDEKTGNLLAATKALALLTPDQRSVAMGLVELLESEEFKQTVTVERVVEKIVEVPVQTPVRTLKKVVNRGPMRCFRCRNSYATEHGRDVHMWKCHPRVAKKLGLTIRKWDTQ